MSECRSCGAPITWAITDNGKRIPLDAEPAPNGNLILVDGVARTPRIDDDVPFLQYVSHFATCPNAQQHRRSRTKSPAGRGLEGR